MADIWVTADQHFGHANIIRYCNRPFDNVERMDDALVEAWNAHVKPRDTVYHLGDLAYGKGSSEAEVYLSRLHGRISLVPGNHDRQPTIDAILSHPDHLLCQPLTDIRLERMPGVMVVLCHYSLREWPGRHHGSIHLFGHSHGKLEKLGRSMDVGVDTNPDYRPYNIEEIITQLLRQPVEV